MSYEEQLRAIQQDQIERLDEAVKVVCHRGTCLPLYIARYGVWEPVEKILERAKDDMDSDIDVFLVRTISQETFALCRRPNSKLAIDKCWWWLAFRVLRAEEVILFERRKRHMLVDLELKNLADKHGHLCPDFAIGWRVGLLARQFMADGGKIVAGSLSCAIEAIQAMGPWNLIIDGAQGEHNYRLEAFTGENLVLRIPKELTWPGGNFLELENRISTHKATLEEVSAYQVQIDKQVERILSASDAELFSLAKTVAHFYNEAAVQKGICYCCGSKLSEDLDGSNTYLCSSCRSRLV